MKVFVIGATGYVGSIIAHAFMMRGSEVSGLARNTASAKKLRSIGVEPVAGDLGDMGHLCDMVQAYDIIVFCPMLTFEEEHRVMEALVAALSGTERTLLFMSGSGVLSIPSLDGAWSEYSFAEDDPFPFPSKFNREIRFSTENLVRASAGAGVRAMVVRPPLIYGHAGSIQIPQLFESARKTGHVCYLGKGLNLYSNVHVDDVAELFCLAAEKGVSGALYHAVAGEANFRSLAEAVALVVGCETRSLDYQQACDLWGASWVDLGLAVNSRCRAVRTRQELGWSPTHDDVIEDIRSGSYRNAYQKNSSGLAYEWRGHSSTPA